MFFPQVRDCIAHSYKTTGKTGLPSCLLSTMFRAGNILESRQDGKSFQIK